eukprot:TRINITY_DN2535_c0_g2_i1.p1 TRINITY_DN2535_c0_g2~~TRINITY_DN2535_c0_g2_i1.p1  ORF type:complete len:254 (-),score=53.72 TRINITY_DN2535_c0_g2_i1:91-807(-)
MEVLQDSYRKEDHTRKNRNKKGKIDTGRHVKDSNDSRGDRFFSFVHFEYDDALGHRVINKETVSEIGSFLSASTKPYNLDKRNRFSLIDGLQRESDRCEEALKNGTLDGPFLFFETLLEDSRRVEDRLDDITRKMYATEVDVEEEYKVVQGRNGKTVVQTGDRSGAKKAKKDPCRRLPLLFPELENFTGDIFYYKLQDPRLYEKLRPKAESHCRCDYCVTIYNRREQKNNFRMELNDL